MFLGKRNIGSLRLGDFHQLNVGGQFWKTTMLKRNVCWRRGWRNFKEAIWHAEWTKVNAEGTFDKAVGNLKYLYTVTMASSAEE